MWLNKPGWKVQLLWKEADRFKKDRKNSGFKLRVLIISRNFSIHSNWGWRCHCSDSYLIVCHHVSLVWGNGKSPIYTQYFLRCPLTSGISHLGMFDHTVGSPPLSDTGETTLSGLALRKSLVPREKSRTNWTNIAAWTSETSAWGALDRREGSHCHPAKLGSHKKWKSRRSFRPASWRVWYTV